MADASAAAAAAGRLLAAAPQNPNLRKNLNRSFPRAYFSQLIESLAVVSRVSLTATSLGARVPAVFINANRRCLVSRAASREDSQNIDEVGQNKDELESKADESEEAWKQTLESFKEEAMKMKDMSAEAYAVYSKQAMVILKETSEKLKIQADKARSDLTLLAKEMSDGSPESVKEAVEAFADIDEIKDVSETRDFHVGIPYGAFLAFSGFLSFMLFGSVSAIRFGIIPGAALVWLGIASRKSWRNGESSEGYLKGQTVIAAFIFLGKWNSFVQRRSILALFMTLISGGILGFYAYRIYKDHGKGQSLEQNSQN